MKARSKQLCSKHSMITALHPFIGSFTSVLDNIRKSSTYLKIASTLGSSKRSWMADPHDVR